MVLAKRLTSPVSIEGPPMKTTASGSQAGQPDASETFTRREFLTVFTAAGAVVLALAAVATLEACADGTDDEEDLFVPSPAGEEPDTLEVDDSQLVEAIEFEDRPLEEFMYESRRFDLPYGSIVRQVDDRLALVLTPHESGSALIDVKLLNLDSGELIELIDKAIGASYMHPDAIVYDARASDSLIAWTECDISNLDWLVFVAQIATDENGGYSLGTPVLVDEGNAEYEVPLLAVAKDKAYWTVMPNPEGSARYEDSYLKMISYNKPKPTVVHTSHGRMITTPLINQGILTFAPRVDTNNVYYQLTALNTANDRLVAGVVMPQSMRILDAVYLDNALSFTIENNYTYAGGLSRFGTYWQLNDDKWLHLYRKPTVPPVLFNGRLIVKSSTRVIAIDASEGVYCSIPPLTDSAEYGDILAGWGKQDRLLVYSNIRNNNALSKAHSVLRVFSPV
ncbi:MAG: hypothetical protein FWH40_03740 [Coriobacteriia bacterium]|nr:hypothetical protein [Coriobacteriia bacterium]